MSSVLAFFLAAAFSFVFAWLIRRYALARGLLDVPNKRSSHAMPTPRGGGVAIVITFLSFMLVCYVQGMVTARSLLALFGSGAMVAVVGFLDDHGHVKARWRLLVHFIGAGLALCWLGLPPLSFFGLVFDLGWLGYLLAVFYLVWLLNLYNFMDGIDGIAGIEAITVCFGAALLALLHSPDSADWHIPLLLVAAVSGFLVWNFPKARIFMGDAGSGFLGITLGILSLQAALARPELFWGWLILLGVFMVDATVTLIRRIVRGEKFYEAHRSHAYQILSRRYGSHVKVTLGVLLINVCWLLPLALISGYFPQIALLFVFIAYLPLVLVAVKVGAGTIHA